MRFFLLLLSRRWEGGFTRCGTVWRTAIFKSLPQAWRGGCGPFWRAMGMWLIIEFIWYQQINLAINDDCAQPCLPMNYSNTLKTNDSECSIFRVRHCTSNQLGICPRIEHVRRIPKVSIFMAMTTKIVTEKAKKWPKMARFWPKSRYNGRVMAREVFFYQCLWVTKFCAKFGCSRTPRTASVPNSFIVLRCMWKEPAPLWNDEKKRWKIHPWWRTLLR